MTDGGAMWRIAHEFATTIAGGYMTVMMFARDRVRYVPDTRYWRRRIEWRKRMANKRRPVSP